MGTFTQPEEVALVLARHYSGYKAVVIKHTENGTLDHSCSHALVAVIDCYPCKATAAKNKTTFVKRSNIKSFATDYNYSHLILTRCFLGVPLIKLSSAKISSETVVLNTGPDAKVRLTSETDAKGAV
ncbi:60S ribosomal protein L27 [Lemmus lemmus]